MFFIASVVIASANNTSESMSCSDTLPEIQVGAERVEVLEKNNAVGSTILFSKQIEQQRHEAVKDLSAVVPNVYMPDYGSKMTSSMYVRGLGARIDNPVMGLMIDNISIANKNSYDFNFFDLRSAEVYRGPQGTMFGRNTIGGVICLTTLSPLQYSGTRAAAGYANHNTMFARASHYHKINDCFGVSAAAYYTRSDGFFTNIYDNSKADNYQEGGARLRMEGILTDQTAISGVVQYDFTDQGGFAYHQPDKPINHNDPCSYLRHNLIAGLTIKSNLPENLSITSTTSYQFLKDDMLMDQDYLPLSYFTLQQKQTEHVVSEDLILRPKKSLDYGWNWLSGLYVSYKHNAMSAPVTFLKDGIDSLILKNANASFGSYQIQIQEPSFVIGSDFLTNEADVALYHTSYYRWQNKWQIEAGVRLEYEHQWFNYNSHGSLHACFYNNSTQTSSPYTEINSRLKGNTALNYFEALPRVAVSYNANNWAAYASVSEGYKAGGFNTQLFSDILQNQMRKDMIGTSGADYNVEDVITYKPERCITFEIGASAQKRYDDWRLQGALTAYELEVFNQQQTVFPKVGTGRLMTNAGHSRSAGAEATANISWKDLQINASYGYTYAIFTKYNNGQADYSGKRVPYVPSNTLAAGITYKIAFNHSFFRSLQFNINTTAYGKIYWSEENDFVQPFYALLNANICLQMKYIELELWGKNLTNTDYNVFRFVSMGNTFVQSGKPITFGAILKFEI